MDNISIKDHPPWYARGTPVTHNRDGPAFDLSAYVVPDNVKMEAIRGEPSARGEPKGKFRLWLTLKTTFFNTNNSVYGWWYGMLFGDTDRSRDAVRSVEEDLSAFAEPDNVERKMVDVDSFVGDADRSRDAVRSVEEDLTSNWRKTTSKWKWEVLLTLTVICLTLTGLKTLSGRGEAVNVEKRNEE